VLGNESNCGNTQQTLDRALQLSCNTAFANLGAMLGADKIRAQAEKFGFNTTPMTDVNAAKSQFPKNLDAAQTMLSAIGQYDVAASPLQMAMVVSAICNDGVLKTPYLVSEVRSADLRVLYRHGPDDKQAMSAPSAQALQQMMVNVVQKGTGTKAQVAGVVVGGKTGTAQTDPTKNPYAWFLSFARDPPLRDRGVHRGCERGPYRHRWRSARRTHRQGLDRGLAMKNLPCANPILRGPDKHVQPSLMLNGHNVPGLISRARVVGGSW